MSLIKLLDHSTYAYFQLCVVTKYIDIFGCRPSPPLASAKALSRARFDRFKSSSQSVIFSGIFTQFDPSED